MVDRLGKSIRDIKDIQKKIEFAKKIVANEKEPFKTESFKIILEKLLSFPDQVDAYAPQENISIKEPTQPNLKKIEFAKDCSISIEELEDVFTIKDDSIKIIAPIQGNESFKRLIATLCYLLAAEIILGKEWVESKELAEIMREIGVKDLANLAPKLKKHTDYFRIDAKPGNNKYKLTSGVGRKKAIETVNKLAKGELFED